MYHGRVSIGRAIMLPSAERMVSLRWSLGCEALSSSRVLMTSAVAAIAADLGGLSRRVPQSPLLPRTRRPMPARRRPRRLRYSL